MDEIVYPKFRWFIMFTMIIVTAITGMALISPAPLIPVIQATMKLDPGRITLLAMSPFILFVALSALYGGYIFDKFGVEVVFKAFIAGMALVACGAFLWPYLGDSQPGMIIIRSLQGAGTGPIMAASATIAASYFPKKERNIVAGFQGFSVALGMVVGLMLIPRLATPDNWKRVLMIVGPICIIGIILSIIVIALSPKQEKIVSQGPPGAEDAAVTHAFKKALESPVLWVVISCYFLMSYIFQAFNDVSPGYINVAVADLKGSLGLEQAKGGDFLVLAQILFMFGAIVGGFLTDKVFKGSGRPVVAMGFLLGAFFVWFIVKGDFIEPILSKTLKPASITLFQIFQFNIIDLNQAGLVFYLTAAAFFFAFVNPQTIGYIAKNYPKEIAGKLGGMATGISIFGGWLGGTIGPIAIEKSGYPMSYYIVIVLLVLGFIVSLFMHPGEK